MQYSIKHRPSCLDDMFGHKTIVKEFKKRSVDMNYPQAILLSGNPGTGKDTFAFIIAKLINCKNPIQKDGYKEPCNECSSCKSVIDESFKYDIQLLDSTKLNKQDLIGLEEIADTSPLFSPNKVIIIDEIQELTVKHHNTLLKLLETPRQGVYFILTTMHLDKLSKAVVSRCQHYKLKLESVDTISEYLFNVLKKENLLDKVDEAFINEGLFVLAENSQGSFRNAVQYLERCIYGEYWTEEAIMKEFGFIDSEKLQVILKALINKDPNFFNLIESVDIKEFYFKSFATFIEAEIYKFTKKVKYKFKTKMYEFLSKSDIKEIFKIYLDINNMITYNFKENLFMAKIIEFFNNDLSFSISTSGINMQAFRDVGAEDSKPKYRTR